MTRVITGGGGGGGVGGGGDRYKRGGEKKYCLAFLPLCRGFQTGPGKTQICVPANLHWWHRAEPPLPQYICNLEKMLI